jgi:hypothetical protein
MKNGKMWWINTTKNRMLKNNNDITVVLNINSSTMTNLEISIKVLRYNQLINSIALSNNYAIAKNLGMKSNNNNYNCRPYKLK